MNWLTELFGGKKGKPSVHEQYLKASQEGREQHRARGIAAFDEMAQAQAQGGVVHQTATRQAAIGTVKLDLTHEGQVNLDSYVLSQKEQDALDAFKRENNFDPKGIVPSQTVDALTQDMQIRKLAGNPTGGVIPGEKSHLELDHQGQVIMHLKGADGAGETRTETPVPPIPKGLG